jgi:hypothetical protein
MLGVVSAERHIAVAPMTEEHEHRLKQTRDRKHQTYLHKTLASTQLKDGVLDPFR